MIFDKARRFAGLEEQVAQMSQEKSTPAPSVQLLSGSETPAGQEFCVKIHQTCRFDEVAVLRTTCAQHVGCEALASLCNCLGPVSVCLMKESYFSVASICILKQAPDASDSANADKVQSFCILFGLQ